MKLSVPPDLPCPVCGTLVAYVHTREFYSVALPCRCLVWPSITSDGVSLRPAELP